MSATLDYIEEINRMFEITKNMRESLSAGVETDKISNKMYSFRSDQLDEIEKIVEGFHFVVARLENDLSVKIEEYNRVCESFQRYVYVCESCGLSADLIVEKKEIETSTLIELHKPTNEKKYYTFDKYVETVYRLQMIKNIDKTITSIEETIAVKQLRANG